jgi:hypothetical protein
MLGDSTAQQRNRSLPPSGSVANGSWWVHSLVKAKKKEQGCSNKPDSDVHWPGCSALSSLVSRRQRANSNSFYLSMWEGVSNLNEQAHSKRLPDSRVVGAAFLGVQDFRGDEVRYGITGLREKDLLIDSTTTCVLARMYLIASTMSTYGPINLMPMAGDGGDY